MDRGRDFAWCKVWLSTDGGADPRAARWNKYPVNVDDDPSRVWNWRDPQFLRAVFPERANK